MSATHHLPTENLYLDLVPQTPLVPVALDANGPTVFCKLEFLNPSGSTKDRIASYILTKAWRSGTIHSGSLVVEASSGSTSISMALVCAQLGVHFIAVMPAGVSNERSLMIKAFGGEVRLSPAEDGLAGCLKMAREIADAEDAFLPLQFENCDNAAAHRFVTAREIICQVPGETVDAIVSGVGTGGTLVGLYHGFCDHGCRVKPIAAIPVSVDDSPADVFHSPECCSFSTRIPGVVDKMSKLYQPEALEGLVELQVPDDVALETTRQLIRRGYPVGPSSGLNYAAAAEVANSLDPDATIVTVFPDRMERYFSTGLFEGVDER